MATTSVDWVKSSPVNKMKRSTIIFIAILTLFLLIQLIIPYWKSSIYQWDAAGHAVSAQFVKEELFPGAIGWNPSGYMGFPHNQFYPPLFSYLVASLSFITGLEIAFKLIVTLSVLILPLGFYSFARSLKLTEEQSIFFSMLAILLLSLPSGFFANYQIGGNFDSLFYVGLVTNSFGLAIMLFYFAAIPKIDNKKYFILATILLASVVLTHAFIAIISILYSLSFPITKCIQKERIKTYIKHYLLAFLLTSFWSIPFLFKREYSKVAFIPFQIDNILIISILLLCGILALLFYKKQYSMFPISVFTFLLLTLIAVMHWFFMPFHTYRFLLIIYIVLLLLISKLTKLKTPLLILTLIVIIFLSANYTNYHFQDKTYEKPIYYNSEGRMLFIGKQTDQSPSFQTLEHLLPIWNKQPGIHYLFIESAIHGEQCNTLKKLIADQSQVWGAYWNSLNRDKVPSRETHKYVTKTLDLFGIKNIITNIESSSLNYTKKTYLFSTPTYVPYLEFSSSNDSVKGGYYSFIISKKTNKIYRYFGDNLLLLETKEINPEDFYLKDSLYDEFVLCDQENFYLLRKNQYLDFNTYSYHKFNMTEIQNMTNTTLSCSHNTIFPNITDPGSSYYSKFTSIPVIEITNYTTIRYTQTHGQQTTKEYYLYEFETPALIEPIKTNLSSKYLSQKKWSNFISNWFLSPNYNTFYVNSKQNFTINPEAAISNIQILREKISFTINSKNPALVLIKVSYFPNWKAYNNGKQIPVYQISPYLIMVNSQGPVELKYKKLTADYLGIFLTLLGIIILLFRTKKYS